MSRTRTRVGATAAALLLALSVAACGTSESSNDGPGNADVATGGTRFRTADAETAKLGSDAEPGVFPRTVTDARGTVEIPTEPARVVVLDGGELDDVLSLGIAPVGVALPADAPTVPEYLADKVEGIAVVGTTKALDLEAIAALDPDLILGSTLRADALYDQLSGIAPTVFSIRPGFPWKENFLLVADALGKEDAATAVLDEYQAHADRVRGSIVGDPTISLVRFMPERIRLYARLSFIGVILDDVGLRRPENQQIEELATEVSAENIGQADADRIFYSEYGNATQMSAVVSGPLWKNIPAVRDGNARQVDDAVWFLALGPTGARLVLDDLGRLLGAQ